jgi:redox-sensitive bicupin YhaK (pirin superfamily)
LRDRFDGVVRTVEFLWLTAGCGVINNEDVEPLGKLRILQLWVTMPSASRWAAPRFTHVAREQAPVRQEPGVEARVYAGTSGDVHAASHLYLPMTMVDVRLGPNVSFDQEVPASYSGFIYPLEGEVVVDGESPERVAVGHLGWLAFGGASTRVRLTAGKDGARVMLYAGERQNVPIVTHGPFVGETRADLVRVSQAYIDGRMPRVSELPR